MPHCKGWKPQKLKQWECETNKKIVHHHIPHSLSLSPSTRRRLHSRNLHPLKCNGWFSLCTACSPDRRGLTSEPGNEILYIYIYVYKEQSTAERQPVRLSLIRHPSSTSQCGRGSVYVSICICICVWVWGLDLFLILNPILGPSPLGSMLMQFLFALAGNFMSESKVCAIVLSVHGAHCTRQPRQYHKTQMNIQSNFPVLIYKSNHTE